MADMAADATRWQGFTHKELYKLLHEGAGPGASADPSRRWAEIAGTLGEVGQDLKQALDKSASVWSGQAAGSARERLTGLMAWAQETATGATAMRHSVESQADFLAKARAEMPVPEEAAPAAPDPTGGAVQQVIAAQRDKEPVDASSSTGAQRAFEVMTTYQRNTSTNTTAMAAFHAPAELLGPLDLSRHQHGGVVLSTSVLSITIGAPEPPPDHSDRGDHGDHGDHQHGEGHHHSDWDGTVGAGFEGDLVRRPTFAPGSFTVAAPLNEPFLGPTIGWSGFDNEYGSDSGRSAGAGRGGSTSVGAPASGGAPTSGGASGGAPTSGGAPASGGSTSGPGNGSAAGSGPHSADFQSAAAGQAAAAAGTPAAATPGAAAGTGPAGSADPGRGALRRFGMDTIGSGQWFGDASDYEIRGATPTRRRRDLTQPEPVTESVSIDGEEHQLPHNVIGEGPH